MAADRVSPIVLESPLPGTLLAGRATALFLFGRADGVPVVRVGGVPHRVAAARMPRPDHAGARVGWWATVPVPAHAAGDDVVLTATVGAGAPTELGRIAVAERAAAADGPPVGPDTVAVCLATHDPDPALFDVQLASLRAQTDADWVCVISDDASSPEAIARIEAAVVGDDRFTVHPGGTRRGFYRNFERAIALAPPDAGLLALCDQDDRWHPEKLATLRAARGDAGLVYSDMRLTDPGGRVLQPSMWTSGRANNHTDLASMLVANTITGAATLFTRRVAELALPFPDTPGLQFHDHWLALVALAAGDVAYVDRPLYDYVQHAGAVFGDVTSGSATPRATRPLAERTRAAYFCGYLAREVAAVALLARLGDALTPRKRRALTRFADAGRSPAAAAWLAGRRLRTLTGRTETLGGEADLTRGLLWRATAQARLARDARFPDPLAFEQKRLRTWRAGLVGSAP